MAWGEMANLTGRFFDDAVLLHEVGLAPRLRSVLTIHGIKTVGDVRAKSDAELFSLPRVGPVSLIKLRKLFGPSRSKDPRRLRIL